MTNHDVTLYMAVFSVAFTLFFVQTLQDPSSFAIDDLCYIFVTFVIFILFFLSFLISFFFYCWSAFGVELFEFFNKMFLVDTSVSRNLVIFKILSCLILRGLTHSQVWIWNIRDFVADVVPAFFFKDKRFRLFCNFVFVKIYRDYSWRFSLSGKRRSIMFC